MSAPLRVPFHRPSIGDEEIAAVVETLRSGWLTTGIKTTEFESAFQAYIRAPFAQAVNSCTSGLHLVLSALGIGAGDEVITTPMTFCATVNVILHAGAVPVLADIGPDGNIDPASITSRLTPRTRAILPVHIGGLPCDLDAIWAIARDRNLSVIEDCAHAIGAQLDGRPIGCGFPPSSTAAVFSFYATKNLTTGEGGMITTPDRALAARLKTLSLHGIDRDSWDRHSAGGHWAYRVTEPGFKCNLTDIQAALGLEQLRKLEGFTARRSHIAERYREMLDDCDTFELPESRARARHAWHLYSIRLNLDRLTVDRAAFIEALREEGIEASVHFIPITLHPAYASWALRPENSCPAALRLFPRLVSLPLYPGMTDDNVEFVGKTVKNLGLKFRVPCSLALTPAVSLEGMSA